MDQSQQGKEKYQQLVDHVSPNSHIISDCIKAFLVGGGICTLGQWMINSFIAMNFSKDDAGMYTSEILIIVSILLTGLGVFDKIAKVAGAGTVVPITGFANSMAAPAIEYKKEGFILGVGAKMFVIAGPVIVYGILSSVIVGAIYYFLK